MKKRQNKTIKKQKKRFFKTKIIILFLIILFLLFIIVNSILRKEIFLKNNEIQALEKIFPEEHIKTIKVYEGGLFSLGSTKTLCNSIYFRNNFETSLLIHELTHTYQAKTTLKCIRMSASSLYYQFLSFLKYGSRDYTYYYEINQNKDNSILDYNPEQEASIIEDYFNLKFLNEKISNTYCSNCQNYSKQELIEKLDMVVTKILDKYNN